MLRRCRMIDAAERLHRTEVRGFHELVLRVLPQRPSNEGDSLPYFLRCQLDGQLLVPFEGFPREIGRQQEPRRSWIRIDQNQLGMKVRRRPNEHVAAQTLQHVQVIGEHPPLELPVAGLAVETGLRCQQGIDADTALGGLKDRVFDLSVGEQEAGDDGHALGRGEQLDDSLRHRPLRSGDVDRQALFPSQVARSFAGSARGRRGHRIRPLLRLAVTRSFAGNPRGWQSTGPLIDHTGVLLRPGIHHGLHHRLQSSAATRCQARGSGLPVDCIQNWRARWARAGSSTS